MVPGRIIAACLALIGFAVAVVAGLAAENSARTTIWRAIGALVVCYIAGRVIGAVGHRAVHEHIRQYKQTHPLHEEQESPVGESDSPAA